MGSYRFLIKLKGVIIFKSICNRLKQPHASEKALVTRAKLSSYFHSFSILHAAALAAIAEVLIVRSIFHNLP